jgi:hypothetical protein
MSQFIEEFCNDLANINDNFLNVKEINQNKMSEKIAVCKIPLLFKEQVRTINSALKLAKCHWEDMKCGNDEWDEGCDLRLQEIQEVINDLEKTSWKELPTPNTLNK